MTRYYLSNRQAKELANGKALQIALPDPGLDPTADLVHWAAERLPDVDRGAIRDAVQESIEVYRQRGETSQLADEIGVVRLDQTPHQDRLTWWIEVVVVTICERGRPRSTYPVQWPARYALASPAASAPG